MKRKKFYILITLLITMIIFSTAAICNQCSIAPPTTTEKVEVKSTTETSTTSAETTSETTTVATTTTSQTKETTADASTVITAGIVNHGKKQIALTFDAGWLYENTDALLNLLDEYNIKATFFVRGLWVKDHPELAIEIVSRGHDLENHSLTHGYMSTMTNAEVEKEISGTTDMIKETTGFLPNLFRPPYGEYDKRILRILKADGYLYTILWTVDSYDWAEEMNGVKITKDYLVRRVLKGASDNGIILMQWGVMKQLTLYQRLLQV